MKEDDTVILDVRTPAEKSDGVVPSYQMIDIMSGDFLVKNINFKIMSYYFSKTLTNVSFEEAIEKVTESLKEEGFGILTEIDVKETMKEKLDENFHPYKILGACNAPFAFKALKAENKIGAMLPCNVIVQQSGEDVEVAAVDPVQSMRAVNNKQLGEIAKEIQSKLKSVIQHL